MAEYSKIARGSFTSTGFAQIINLPFQPGYVQFTNYTNAFTAAAASQVVSAEWYASMGQGFAVQNVYDATPDLVMDAVITGGISTFSAGQMLQFGPTLTVTTITKASPAVVTTSTAHGLKSGDVVIFMGLFETTSTGMPQLDGIPFTVTVTGATTFTIPWNTNQSNYTAISGAATGTPRVKQVLYPYLYFPGTTFITAITAPNGTTIPTGTVQIDTTDAHNFVVGQEIAFRIPQQWGSVEFNSLPNVPVPGSPIYGYVVSVVDYNSVIVTTPFSATFTAFNSNQTVASVPGLSYPQIVAVGDVNTGGVQISANSPLYPSPYFVPIGDGSTLTNGSFLNRVSTINGPAIMGAFVNNTSQGFIIGAGAGVNVTGSVLVGAEGDVIHWLAIYPDMVLP